MTSLTTVRAGLSLGNPLPFAAIPHALISDRRLRPIDVVLAGHLLRYARGKASCWPSVATLAADCDRCERTVQYSLARLREAGHVSLRPDGNPTGRLIVLNWRAGATPSAGGVQPYSQGLPRLGGRPVAPEGEIAKEKPAPPPIQTPITLSEARDLFANWLEYPRNHPLREMAERRIAALLSG